MDTDAISRLLPLGGASVLLIYMLRIWLTEQRRWGKEREEVDKRHRADMADREADYIRHVTRLRAQIADLEAQIDDARASIADLKNLVEAMKDERR